MNVAADTTPHAITTALIAAVTVFKWKVRDKLLRVAQTTSPGLCPANWQTL